MQFRAGPVRLSGSYLLAVLELMCAVTSGSQVQHKLSSSLPLHELKRRGLALGRKAQSASLSKQIRVFLK